MIRTKQLSRREQAVMAFVARFHADNGYAPTLREIQEGVSISSLSVVEYQLASLERAGLITREPKMSRTIRIVGDAARWETAA